MRLAAKRFLLAHGLGFQVCESDLGRRNYGRPQKQQHLETEELPGLISRDWSAMHKDRTRHSTYAE
jgi:hypothetical protein